MGKFRPLVGFNLRRSLHYLWFLNCHHLRKHEKHASIRKGVPLGGEIAGTAQDWAAAAAIGLAWS